MNVILKKNKEKEEVLVKSFFLKNYMLVTMYALLFFSIFYQFFIVNKIASFYLFAGFVLVAFFFFFSTYQIYPDKYLKSYLIIAPIYNLYLIVAFWENSVASIVNVFPVILVAYKFYGHRSAFFTTLYLFLVFAISYFIQSLKLIEFIHYKRSDVIISDVFLFIYNIIVIILLFVVKEPMIKMKSVNINILPSQESGKKEPEIVLSKNSEYEVDVEKVNELIIRLDRLMEEQKLFKESSIDISKISIELGVNYSFLSKVIRIKGYSNFNHFINTYRVEFVKKLLKETDLERVTLMYIYTEAGFKNQSTFNRAFKQIEGTTPSEFMMSLRKGNKAY